MDRADNNFQYPFPLIAASAAAAVLRNNNILHPPLRWAGGGR